MTTYIIVNTIILVILTLTCCWLFYNQKNREEKQQQTSTMVDDKLSRIANLDWKVKVLLILAFILILFSLISPFLFTREAIDRDFNFTKTGQIAETIDGLMNPFIALAGVIVTGLAFYIQYKANLLQRESFLIEQNNNKEQLQKQINNQNRQIKIQQFESQFYEMLKLHRENINEMKITGYDFKENGKLEKFEKVTEGRKTFVTMKTEFECILALFRGFGHKLNKEGFEKCYFLFFSGLDVYKAKYSEESEYIDSIKKLRKQHEYPDILKISTNEQRKSATKEVKLNFNYKPFSGHASMLGHYFRHLYLAVKSVANSEIITDYDERMKYLKILRAQLSNHEQILLFYNWLSGYGEGWENEDHRFFTEYCMIHNLWYDTLFKDTFINEKVNSLKAKEVCLRKGNMFEIDD